MIAARKRKEKKILVTYLQRINLNWWASTCLDGRSSSSLKFVTWGWGYWFLKTHTHRHTAANTHLPAPDAQSRQTYSDNLQMPAIGGSTKLLSIRICRWFKASLCGDQRTACMVTATRDHVDIYVHSDMPKSDAQLFLLSQPHVSQTSFVSHLMFNP